MKWRGHVVTLWWCRCLSQTTNDFLVVARPAVTDPKIGLCRSRQPRQMLGRRILDVMELALMHRVTRFGTKNWQNQQRYVAHQLLFRLTRFISRVTFYFISPLSNHPSVGREFACLLLFLFICIILYYVMLCSDCITQHRTYAVVWSST